MPLESRVIIFLSWAGAIFILLSWPFPEYVGTKVTLYDKFFHAFLFGVFAILSEHLAIYFKKIKRSLSIITGLVLSIMYSALAEFWQELIPGRTVSVYDFYAGVAGVVIFLLVAYVTVYRKT